MTGARDRRGSGRSGRERGAVIVLVAVLLIVLIGVASLVVDMGHLYNVRGDLQNTTDSASLAGAIELDRTEEGLERAREQAMDFAARHSADFRRSEIERDDIVFGHWDGQEFQPLGTDPDPGAVNAVRVHDRRADDTSVKLRLAPVIGHTEADVGASAAAVAGGPDTECGAPLGVPECSLDEPLDSGDCDHCLVFSPDGNESEQNAAWMDVAQDGNVGVPTLGQQFRDSCPRIDPVTNKCEPPDPCRNEAVVGDSRDVNTGDHMSRNQQGPCIAIEDRLTRDGAVPEGAPFVVTVPVFADDQCSGPITGGERVIEGYAAFEIFGVSCGQSHDPVVAPGAPDCGGVTSNEKFIAGVLRCDVDSDRPPGGGSFGLDSRRSRLVQ